MYNSGGIPCKIDHHAVTNKLKWDQGVNVAGKTNFVKILIFFLELNYDPILVTCFEGLMEQKHPYNFIVPAVIKDMLLNEVFKFFFDFYHKMMLFFNLGSRIQGQGNCGQIGLAFTGRALMRESGGV